jgi:DNA polymerase III subunit gamma/tau
MTVMSYVVLARKYRPRTFAQMVGQPHVVRALTNALRQQRLHHAYLFTGTRGIGKTTVSRILAKSLNCTGADGRGGITDEPCGICSACTEIDADRYIDYIELDAASNRSIDEIRDLIERAAYKPGVGRFKVFMIDEAHQLTKDAFNALLKTLEEPPEYLKFVLATTDPEKMLPTVLSRCLQFNLRPMAPETVREHLASVLQAESVAHDEGALRLLSRAARGSMRDALSLTDQAIAYGGGRFDEAIVRAMLGAVDGGVAVELVRALAQRDAAAVLGCVDRLRSDGLSCASTLEQMAGLLQRMAVEQAVPGGAAGADAADADAQAAVELAPLLAADETQLLYSIALHGRAELSLMSDEFAALTMVLLRFLAFPSATAAVPVPPPMKAAPLRAPAPPALAVPARPRVADPVATPEVAAMATPRAAPTSTPAAPAAPAKAAVAAAAVAPAAAAAPSVREPSAADRALGDRWNGLVRKLSDAGALTGLVRELAWQSALVGVSVADVPAWCLCVEHESLRAAGLRDKLRDTLAAELGGALSLEVDIGSADDTPARREAAERTRRQREAEESIRTDPVVRDLMSQFKSARIVPGSIKPI